MTVIAGVSLFNGIMLAADCRVSLVRPARRTVLRDECQKIVQLMPTSAIGVSGDVETASSLIQELLRQLRRGRRLDPVSLNRWLPRFFKAGYAALSAKKAARNVDFMVGSVIRDRMNVIERQRALDLMKEIGFGNPSIQRSFVPDVLVRALMTDASVTRIPIANSVAGLLCTMSSPLLGSRRFGIIAMMNDFLVTEMRE